MVPPRGRCYHTKKVSWIATRKALTCDHVVNGLRAIPGVKCTMPQGAFYAYPNISSFFGKGGVKSASDVAGRLLREAHVATVPGEGFGTTEHIRVSYATSASELDRGLERMRRFFAGLG